ncbi:Glycine cleavage system H protein [subsurface metagenome]
MDLKFPADLKYAPTHEWVRMDGDMATVGISDYAQHKLGDIVYVELPVIGAVLEKGNAACEIESVKAVSELFMPLTGEIVETNGNIADNPTFLNSSPYGEGWIMKIKVSNPDEIKNLLSVEKYQEMIQKEED